jgi:16S rRNA (guanine527-N7)-methyltransferase
LIGSINPKANDVRALLESNNLRIQDDQWERLEAWVDRLVEINRKINLISRKQPDLVWHQHILHSITPLILIKFPENIELCDFGTGGGLPGVPLAILRPDWQIFLLDSRQKKISAIKETLLELGCRNIHFLVGRGEELGKITTCKNRFQWITARAVSSLGNLEKWTRTMRKEGATLIAFKGGNLEIEAVTPLQLPNVTSIEEHPIDLKGYPTRLYEDKKLVEIKFN